ncbi:MAG: polysaccharide deacetylase family protein [Nitrososphaera sp.]|nr:polysaccharide deacetylase family protein [Nitrososphaera sp.]
MNSSRKITFYSPVNWHLKKALGAAMVLLPIARIFEALSAAKARILVYHGITKTPPSVFNWQHIPEWVFRRQMEYLKEHFEIVPLPAMLEEVISRGREHKKWLALSFDDGYENNYSVAYPILKEMSIPATFFISTSFVGERSESLWFDHIYNALVDYSAESADLSAWGFEVIDTSTPEAKAEMVAVICDKLKFMHPNTRETLLAGILSALGVKTLVSNVFPGMTWEQVRMLAADPLMTIGGHGHTHSILTNLSPDEQWAEIKLNRDLLARHTNSDLAIFAYPNGNWDPEVVKTVQRAGYRFAVSTHESFVTSEPYNVPRLTVRNPSTFTTFQALVSGMIPIGQGILKSSSEAPRKTS